MASKTELDTLLVYGVDEKNRRIFFGHALSTEDSDSNSSEITQGSVSYAVRAMMRMASDKPRTPIEIHMSSYGGDTHAMRYLRDIILTLPCQVKFYGGGPIMSSATWIMAVCDERYLYPSARIMIHDIKDSMEDGVTNVKIATEELAFLQDELEQDYADNSRMDKKFWSAISSRDTYLSAEEAVMLGIADEVIPYKKRGNLRRKRIHHLKKKLHHLTIKSLVKKIMERARIPAKIDNITIHLPKEDEVDESLVIEENTPEKEENLNKGEGKDDVSND